MTAQELLDLFRREASDFAEPFLWSDEEVLVFMDDAYKMFVRLTGGIADFSSDACIVDVVAGEALAAIDPRILRIMRATRASDNGLLDIVNLTDMTKTSKDDYGIVRRLFNDKTPGIVRYMVIGRQRGFVQWVQVPEVDDQVWLDIYRLPLTSIKPDGSNLSFAFDEIGEEHHYHLLKWMMARAYDKRDADTYDPVRSDTFERDFRLYCEQSKAEWERYKHKTRIVAYGGL